MAHDGPDGPDPRRAVDEAEERIVGRPGDDPAEHDGHTDPVDPDDREAGTGINEESSG